MPVEQIGFAFDEMEAYPPAASPQPPVQPKQYAPGEKAKCDFVERLKAVLPSLPDDIDYDEPLLAIGLSRHQFNGWYRSRSIEALLGAGYKRSEGFEPRYRRAK